MDFEDIIKASRIPKNIKFESDNHGGCDTDETPQQPVNCFVKDPAFEDIQNATKYPRSDTNTACKNNEAKSDNLQTSESVKMLGTNLDYGVANSQAQELFNEFELLQPVHSVDSRNSLVTIDVALDTLDASRPEGNAIRSGGSVNDGDCLENPEGADGCTKKKLAVSAEEIVAELDAYLSMLMQ